MLLGNYSLFMLVGPNGQHVPVVLSETCKTASNHRRRF